MYGRAMQTACCQRRHSIPARVKRVHREGIREGRAAAEGGAVGAKAVPASPHGTKASATGAAGAGAVVDAGRSGASHSERCSSTHRCISAIQKGTRVLISLWDSLMFGRVPGTRLHISESHSEISTRVHFCIRIVAAAASSSSGTELSRRHCAGGGFVPPWYLAPVLQGGDRVSREWVRQGRWRASEALRILCAPTGSPAHLPTPTYRRLGVAKDEPSHSWCSCSSMTLAACESSFRGRM